MRFFMLVILSLSLAGLVGCGEDQTPNDLERNPTAGGSGANDKPTETEKRELAAAKNQMVAVVHKSAQVLSFNDAEAVVRVVMTINNQDSSPQTFEMDGNSESFSRQIVQGNAVLQLEVVMTRAELGNGNRKLIGLEYRLSRQAGSRVFTASQFISLRAELLNTDNALFKKKFEFPSKSNLFTWVKEQ